MAIRQAAIAALGPAHRGAIQARILCGLESRGLGGCPSPGLGTEDRLARPLRWTEGWRVCIRCRHATAPPQNRRPPSSCHWRCRGGAVVEAHGAASPRAANSDCWRRALGLFLSSRPLCQQARRRGLLRRPAAVTCRPLPGCPCPGQSQLLPGDHLDLPSEWISWRRQRRCSAAGRSAWSGACGDGLSGQSWPRGGTSVSQCQGSGASVQEMGGRDPQPAQWQQSTSSRGSREPLAGALCGEAAALAGGIKVLAWLLPLPEQGGSQLASQGGALSWAQEPEVHGRWGSSSNQWA